MFNDSGLACCSCKKSNVLRSIPIDAVQVEKHRGYCFSDRTGGRVESEDAAAADFIGNRLIQNVYSRRAIIQSRIICTLDNLVSNTDRSSERVFSSQLLLGIAKFAGGWISSEDENPILRTQNPCFGQSHHCVVLGTIRAREHNEFVIKIPASQLINLESQDSTVLVDVGNVDGKSCTRLMITDRYRGWRGSCLKTSPPI